MKNLKFILSLTLIIALALPLFLMPISAADKEPTIEELVELAKESQDYLEMLYEYRLVDGELYKFNSYSEKIRDLAIKFGYYHLDYKIEEKLYPPYEAIVLSTGEIYKLNGGMSFRFPDYVTAQKVSEDIEKYFVTNFLNILFEKSESFPLIYLSSDGHMYQIFVGLYGFVSNVYGLPDWETAKIKDRNRNKITLEFDEFTDGIRSESGITIQYTKTDRGWRISGATGYYEGKDIFAPEIPDTADNSVVYIALASVSLAALAGSVLASKRKKEYTA